MRATFAVLLTIGLLEVLAAPSPAADSIRPADQWRAENHLIDLHQHIDCTTQHLARAVKILDAVGIGVAVNLSGGTVTPGKDGAASEFARNKQLADALFPGRFLQYMNLDYAGWDEPDFAQRAVKQVEVGYRMGAAGFKEFKRLDLMIVDLPKKDFAWNSKFETAVRIDNAAKVWSCEMRIPLKTLSAIKPTAGTHWRVNLFRCDGANRAFLAWRPTLQGTFHAPERFGTLEFTD